MFTLQIVVAGAALVSVAISSACPFMGGEVQARKSLSSDAHARRDSFGPTEDFLQKFEIDDSHAVLTSEVGGPIQDQLSLKAGIRGSTLLEDFIFRQKIMHFDHERVPERAVHARGAGAHGVFTSYADWSNITAASFLGSAGKETATFVRFSTVAGSRGSADTARDVHGFATRFYTDQGNYDIVGNNIPVFFIQDAILFPDLIHAVKPNPDREIPQAATAHDSAWDFFSQQPSTLHTLFWAMSPHGIPRSYRHMNGFGVHTFRFVNDDGKTKLVKFRWKTLQGTAGLVWDEAQVTSGKNADLHRQDLWDSIADGQFPEYEFQAQVMEEEDQLRFGFDLLDPTKIVPKELVPFTPLGKMVLNRNPRNYFAETEQIMFQPSHVVRGIDFTEDPLLQGRLFSYLDTQLNRHRGPNFEQLPINQPRVPWHNNNRDGAAQMYIPLNTAAYSPNTLNAGYPAQANQASNRGFFTAPNRAVSGTLVRAESSTFADVWSQPRVFFNSLLPAEQQMVVDAIRFETSNVQSNVVRNNVLVQLNRISNDVAVRVAHALGMAAPAPDPTFYTTNRTADVSVFEAPLLKLDGLKVGFLTSAAAASSGTAAALQSALSALNVSLVTVAESLSAGAQTYSAAAATGFDAVLVADGAAALFSAPPSASAAASTLYPPGRPLQLVLDAYRWGKPVGALGASRSVLADAGINASSAGVYVGDDVGELVAALADGLRTFRFLDRLPMDQ